MTKRQTGERDVSLFEVALSVPAEDIEILLRERCHVAWADFLLNPRRLRGSDFLMRWSQGVWSEERVVEAVSSTNEYFALPYGPSGTAPHDVREAELYFERLDNAGLAELKRPDLLVFRSADGGAVTQAVQDIGGVRELPFTREEHPAMDELLRRATLAVECETSLWRASRMPDYGARLRPMARLGGALGLKKSAVLPTVIVKEEDRNPLLAWQEQRGVELHIWHVFYDMAFGLSLDRVEELIRNGSIEPTEQVYQAPGGATTRKIIYRIYYHYAYPVGSAREEPALVPDFIEDKNGHILPYVRFQGGGLALDPEALRVLRSAEDRDANRPGR